jgi:hypothetical protein
LPDCAARTWSKGGEIMTAVATTLGRLRALERLYVQGYADEVVDLTLRKLLEHQIQKDEAQLADLRGDLTRFERRYAMSSADFFARYQAGQMGDDADVFEWNALYKMQVRLADAVEVLRSQLRE